MGRLYCKLVDSKENEDTFLVALLDAPSFPDDGLPIHKVVREPNRAVVAANIIDGAWSFIWLEIEEKHCVGDMLLNSDALIGEWQYCQMFRED